MIIRKWHRKSAMNEARWQKGRRNFVYAIILACIGASTINKQLHENWLLLSDVEDKVHEGENQ